MTPDAMPKPCPPRVYFSQDPDGVLYRCAAALQEKDLTDPHQACVGSGPVSEHWKGPVGTMICGDCKDVFEGFVKAAYDARARRKEWEELPT